MRDLAIHQGRIEPLIDFTLFKDQLWQFMSNITWVISNIYKHKDPATSLNVIRGTDHKTDAVIGEGGLPCLP